MKKFLVIDATTLLPMGIYQSPKENLNAITSNRELVHIEIEDGFQMDEHEVVKDNGNIKLIKK